jgi:hypothetical protein
LTEPAKTSNAQFVIEIQALATQAQDLTWQAHAADDPRTTADTHAPTKHRRHAKRKAGR